MEVAEESVEYSDGVEENYNKNKSTKELAFSILGSIANLLKKELYGGYMQDKPVKIGEGTIIVKTYVPDSREAYCELMDYLIALSYPYIENTDFKKEVDKMYEDEETNQPDVTDRIKIRKALFRKLNIIFEDEGFFDTYTGVKE